MNTTQPTSQTLRSFSLVIETEKGTAFDIRYGYDMSAINSGHYIAVSIDRNPLTQAKKALKRVHTLGIDGINQLMSVIGTDVTGAPFNYATNFNLLLAAWRAGTSRTEQILEQFTQLLGLTTLEQKSELARFLNDYSVTLDTTRSESKLKSMAQKYMNSHRLRMMDRSRDAIRALRLMHKNGVEIDGIRFYPKMLGHVPFYYKRDIDYIRKARLSLFKNVLKRKYVPFS